MIYYVIYSKLFKKICAEIPNVDFLKGFIFVPKPDDFLMKDKKLENYYNWVTGMKNAPYTDVIEGDMLQDLLTKMFLWI